MLSRFGERPEHEDRWNGSMYILSFVYTVAILVELAFFTCTLFFIAWRARNGHPYGWSSSLVTGALLLLIFIALLAGNLIPYPYNGYLVWWTGAWVCITILHARKVHVSTCPRRDLPATDASVGDAASAKVPNAGAPGDNAAPCMPAVADHDGLKPRHEWARKAFHLAGFLAVFSYFLVAPLLAPLVNEAIIRSGPAYTAIWGPVSEATFITDPVEAGRTLTLFALLATTILVSLVDVVRLVAGEPYSLIFLIEKRAGRILREKEKGSPGPQVYIAVSATASWIIGSWFQAAVPWAMEATLAGILISTVADGAAAIIGKARGKHKIERPFGQVKSVEGLLAGFVTGVICAIFLVPFWWLAFVAAGVFMALDYLSPPVADNAITSVAMTVVLLVLGMLA